MRAGEVVWGRLLFLCDWMLSHVLNWMGVIAKLIQTDTKVIHKHVCLHTPQLDNQIQTLLPLPSASNTHLQKREVTPARLP